ncbi:ribonuclease H-like [Heptranchias perlo]|uniref:ribonuclease H-like n=1 Tax=Heptranchias perlo TaxID=212740 RepID=UPI0035594864
MGIEGKPHEYHLGRGGEEEWNVRDTLLTGEDVIDLFVDGSRRFDNGKYRTGWAVVDRDRTQVRTGRLWGKGSARQAELTAILKAILWGKNKRVNIYTDSSYAWGACVDYAPTWRRWGYVTSSGMPVKHACLLKDMMDGLQGVGEAATIKVKAHQAIDTPEQFENAKADLAAKSAENRTQVGTKHWAVGELEKEVDV